MGYINHKNVETPNFFPTETFIFLRKKTASGNEDRSAEMMTGHFPHRQETKTLSDKKILKNLWHLIAEFE